MKSSLLLTTLLRFVKHQNGKIVEMVLFYFGKTSFIRLLAPLKNDFNFFLPLFSYSVLYHLYRTWNSSFVLQSNNLLENFLIELSYDPIS